MRIAVKFMDNPKEYCYSAPEGTRKGDLVQVPGHFGYRGYWVSPSFGVVVGRFPNYKGRVKSVLKVYRQVVKTKS